MSLVVLRLCLCIPASATMLTEGSREHAECPTRFHQGSFLPNQGRKSIPISVLVDISSSSQRTLQRTRTSVPESTSTAVPPISVNSTGSTGFPTVLMWHLGPSHQSAAKMLPDNLLSVNASARNTASIYCRHSALAGGKCITLP